jgi:hypothetical protein
MLTAFEEMKIFLDSYLPIRISDNDIKFLIANGITPQDFIKKGDEYRKNNP